MQVPTSQQKEGIYDVPKRHFMTVGVFFYFVLFVSFLLLLLANLSLRSSWRKCLKPPPPWQCPFVVFIRPYLIVLVVHHSLNSLKRISQANDDRVYICIHFLWWWWWWNKATLVMPSLLEEIRLIDWSVKVRHFTGHWGGRFRIPNLTHEGTKWSRSVCLPRLTCTSDWLDE